MYVDRLILIFVLAAYLLSPVIINWWSNGGTEWYQPFTVWAILIAVSYWVARSRDLDDL